MKVPRDTAELGLIKIYVWLKQHKKCDQIHSNDYYKVATHNVAATHQLLFNNPASEASLRSICVCLMQQNKVRSDSDQWVL